MNLPIRLALIVGVTAFASLVSCVSGPSYAEAKQSGGLVPKPGKGMTLIYCSPGFVGKAAKIPVYANDVLLPKPLRRGGFYTYESSPGTVSISNTPPLVRGNLADNMVAGALQGTMSGGPIGTVAGAFGAAVGTGLGVVFAPKRKEVVVQVSANEIYYVDLWNLQKATRQEAEEELEECHWLNPK